MPKVTAKPSAPVSARETERKAKRTASADENVQFVRDAEERILNAPNRAVWELDRKLRDAGVDNDDARSSSVEVFTIVALAAEAAAAKAAGYETWAAFEAAQAARRIGDLA